MPEAFDFLSSEVTQGDLVTFADDRVNLKREHAQKYRDQINNLREHLETYINEHPDIGLVKLLMSGSLAKGMALSTINDADVAMYMKSDGAPRGSPRPRSKKSSSRLRPPSNFRSHAREKGN